MDLTKCLVIVLTVCMVAACSDSPKDLFSGTHVGDVDGADGVPSDGATSDTRSDIAEVFDTDASGQECPGGFMCPCVTASDCRDELCVEGMGGRVCTRTCNANCPLGFDCVQTHVDGADYQSICVPREPDCGGCLIDGECQPVGTREPGNPCRECDPARNRVAWSNVGASPCDDGDLCTKEDGCVDGKCRGQAYTCVDDGKACTLEACTAGGTCATTIAPGQCFLDGRCVADGERKDASGCLRCDAATNQWVAVQAGTTCDDGNPCTSDDVCAGVECAGQGSCHPPYWSKKIGGASGDFLRQIVARPGKFVAVGQQTGVVPPNGEGAGTCFFDDVGVLDQRCDYYVVTFGSAGETFERYTFGQAKTAFSQTGASRSFSDNGIVVTGQYANGTHLYSHIVELDDEMRFVRGAELNPAGASNGLYAVSVMPTATGYIVGNGTLYVGGCTNGTAYTRLDATFNVLGKSPGVRDDCNGGVAAALPSTLGGYWLLPRVHGEGAPGIALTSLNSGDAFNWKRVVKPASGYPGTRVAVETANQGLLLAGDFLPSNGSGFGTQGDAWFLATDASGYPIAQGLFGGPGDDEFSGIVALEDGGYLLIGKNGSSGNPQGLVVRLDAAFQVKWQRSFGTPTTASGAFFLGGVEDAGGDVYLVGQYDKSAWIVHLPPDDAPTSGVNPQFVTRSMGSLTTSDANFSSISWDMNAYAISLTVGTITNNQKPVTDAP